MAGPIRTMSQAVRVFLCAVRGQKHSFRETPVPTVVLHDPAARRPHDLDDPFFDPKVQARITHVISRAGQNK